MPWKPKSHRPAANRRHARTTTQRGYGWRHQQFRERVLRERPLCEDCLPVVTPATDVHHVRKIKDRPDLACEDSNVMCLCSECHTKRTSRGE